MRFSCLRVCLALLCLAVADTSFFSMLSATSITELEFVASSIIQYYTPIMYDVQIICESTCLPDNILKKIAVPFQLSISNLYENSLMFLLPQTQTFVTTVLDSTANSTKSKYVIIVDCGDCAIVAWILEQCWHHKLLNVVVIPLHNNDTPIYTYFPFREGFCFDPSPLLIARFTNRSAFNVELFPNRKVWNLQKCTLIVSSFNFTPELYFDGTGMHGYYAPVFKAVADAMNFSYEFSLTDGWVGGASGPNKTGVRGDVYTGRAHIGFAYFVTADLNYIDYDSLAMTTCLTWCVPGTFRNKPVLQLIVGEFTPAVWFSLFLSASSVMLAIVMIVEMLNRTDGYNSYAVVYMMNMWAALLQSPRYITRFTSISLRLVWVCWLLSSVVLSTVYVGTQKSLRTARYNEYSVKNLEDLAEAGLQAWYADNMAHVVYESAKANPAVARLRSNSYIISPDQYVRMFKAFHFRNITGLLTDTACWNYGETYVNEFQLYPVPDACMQRSPFYMFAMAKKSIFTEPISVAMGRLTQAGIVQKNFNKHKYGMGPVIKQTPITLKDLLPVYLLLGFGLLAGFLALLVEKLLRCK